MILPSGETTFTATLWADGLNFPEGPVWVPGLGLLFSDVHGARIYRALPEGGVEPWLDQGIKTNGMALSPDGQSLIACDHGGLRLVQIDLATRAIDTLTSAAPDGPFVNVNDVAVAPAGLGGMTLPRVYFTDPDFGAAARGAPPDHARHAVYCWTPATPKGPPAGEPRPAPAGRIQRAAPAPPATPIAALPNGLALSPDGLSLYVAFSGEHTIRRYTRLPDGSLGGGDIFVRLEPGANPDGMAIDPDQGWLWQTQYGNGRIEAFALDSGQRVHSLTLASGAVTNVAIEPGTGGRVLWVTGASTPESPGGKLWRIERSP